MYARANDYIHDYMCAVIRRNFLPTGMLRLPRDAAARSRRPRSPGRTRQVRARASLSLECVFVTSSW